MTMYVKTERGNNGKNSYIQQVDQEKSDLIPMVPLEVRAKKTKQSILVA
jgi:hypothetical protein